MGLEQPRACPPAHPSASGLSPGPSPPLPPTRPRAPEARRQLPSLGALQTPPAVASRGFCWPFCLIFVDHMDIYAWISACRPAADLENPLPAYNLHPQHLPQGLEDQARPPPRPQRRLPPRRRSLGPRPPLVSQPRHPAHPKGLSHPLRCATTTEPFRKRPRTSRVD